MKEGTASTHNNTVREFLEIISYQAKAATAGLDPPGVLQMSRLHPASEQLVPSRYLIGDIEHMLAAAGCDSEAGHKVYIDGRNVRGGLRGSSRGRLADTAAVFALTIDSDAEKQMGWAPTTRVSATVETSPGNFQFWFFLREAVGPELAQRLGE